MPNSIICNTTVRFLALLLTSKHLWVSTVIKSHAGDLKAMLCSLIVYQSWFNWYIWLYQNINGKVLWTFLNLANDKWSVFIVTPVIFTVSIYPSLTFRKNNVLFNRVIFAIVFICIQPIYQLPHGTISRPISLSISFFIIWCGRIQL